LATAYPSLPVIDGVTLTDNLYYYASDQGNITHKFGYAAFKPAGPDDIETIVDWCNFYKIQCQAKGKGHDTFGHSQVANDQAVVIDTFASPVTMTVNVTDKTVTVQGNPTWAEVINYTGSNYGLFPIAQPLFVGMTIFGNAQLGGNGNTIQKGYAVDYFLEMTVITGEGDVVTCSPTKHTNLFNAVRGGLGQFAIIISAKIALYEAPDYVRVYTLIYGYISTAGDSFYTDMVDDTNVNTVESISGVNVASVNPTTFAITWSYFMTVSKYWSGTPPNNTAILANFHPLLPPTYTDLTYLQWSLRNSVALASNGINANLDTLIPKSNVTAFWGDIKSEIQGAYSTSGRSIAVNLIVLSTPINGSTVKIPLKAVPSDDIAAGISILPSLGAAGAINIPIWMDTIQALYEIMKYYGGKLYAYGTLRQPDWDSQFTQNQLDFMKQQKDKHDSNCILNLSRDLFDAKCRIITAAN
jgi:hypothetical protein